MGSKVVCDFDDVLVNTSYALFKSVKENWRLFSKWFWDPGELTLEEVQSRNFFNINEWLIKKKFENYTSKQYAALQIEISEFIKETYFDKNPYSYLEPNNFAKETLQNPLYIDSKNIEKVIILSRNMSDSQDKNKKEFIEKYFNNPKIEYSSISRFEKKGEFMKKNGISFDVIIDDEIPNIRNIAETFMDLNKKEFIIPSYGYNNMPKELRFLIEEHGGSITYYNQFKK